MEPRPPQILVLATVTCAYPGADTVGQAHMSYPANAHILPVPSPSIFPEKFYMDCFHKGIGGIIVMSCGTDCPYEGAYHALANTIDKTYALMKEEGIDLRRLRLTAMCTVCTHAFVKEVNAMDEILHELSSLDEPTNEALCNKEVRQS